MRASPAPPEVGSRIEGLLDELGSAVDPRTSEKLEELVRLLMELYGSGLGRIVELAALDEEGGARLLERLVDDELVSSLLVLHGLHPLTLDERIEQALEKVRPYLGSHAGGVRYLGVDAEDVVHLRLEGSCDGCPSSTVTVKLAIERAIREAAPEVVDIDVEGQSEPEAPVRGLVQIAPFGGNGAAPPASGESRAGDWAWVGDLGSLVPGETRAVDVAGSSVLVCSVEGSLYAYRNSCAACGSLLEGASLESERLTCPQCRRTFDVRLAGRSTDGSELHLQPLPLLPGEGGANIAIHAMSDR